MNYVHGVIYAVLAAVCASVVGILAKVGMKDVPPVLATAVRSIVMMLVCIIVAIAAGMGQKVRMLHSTAVMMIVLSGIAGAASWVFGFLAYDKIGVSKTSPIDKLSVPLAVILAVLLLGERVSRTNWVGVVLIVIGAYLTAIRD